MTPELKQAIEEAKETYYKWNQDLDTQIRIKDWKDKYEYALTLAIAEIDAKESILTKIKEALMTDEEIENEADNIYMETFAFRTLKSGYVAGFKEQSTRIQNILDGGK